MTQTLAHRGPDGNGHWLSKVANVGLGHRRLSIIDLSENGAQPMVFAENHLAMVYNGLIYNFQELKDELVARGSAFRGHSDTEVLLRAYQIYGTKIFPRLSGMFSVAILDEREQKLILARDPCGQKPLYYHHQPGELSFASEVKALYAFNPTLHTIDDDGLTDYLAYGYTLGPATLTAGIQKVLPGEMLTYDLRTDELQPERYAIPVEAGPRNLSLDEAETKLESLLEDSVDRHLVSDVPVGLLLSGGIDSSLITALAARSREHLKTFSVIFPNQPDRNEAEYARAVAQHYGTEHLELEMQDFDFETLETLACQFDDPISDHAIIPTYLLSRQIREHVTAALSGDGSDELFGGYPHYGLMPRQEALRRIPSPIRNLAAAGASRMAPGTKGRNHAIGLSGSIENAIAHVNMLFDARQRADLTGLALTRSPEERKIHLLADCKGNAVEKAMYNDYRTTMAEGYLTKVDRAAMLASLEVRAPFLDKAVVDFAWRDLGPEMKFRNGQDKILPRRLAARLLPTKVAEKPKKGLTMPLDAWLRDGAVTFLKDVLLDPSQTLFDRKAVQRLFDLQARGRNNGSRIFSLAMLTLWAKHYGMSRA